MSSGVRWALRFLYNYKADRLAGIELAEILFQIAAENKLKVFLLGAKNKVIAAAAGKIKEKYKELEVAGYRNGYFDDADSEAVVSEIARSGADILLAGLGIPKQEIWLFKNKEKLGVKISVGVGGSFDVISGRLKRSPRVFIVLGVEWLYPLLIEPWRIKRIVRLPIFILEVFKMKFESR